MAILDIKKAGDLVLKQQAQPIERIDKTIRTLLDDMAETMYKANGVGLAAPQVGILKRIIVIDLYDDKGPIKLVNPVIIKEKGEQEVEEGCLSFPNQYAKIIRPMEVKVKALNENGEEIKISAKGLLAQALAHEIDHLDGILFIDKIIPGTLEFIEQNQ